MSQSPGVRTAAVTARVSPGASAAPARLQVKSRFADVEVDARDVITFVDGIPGYEGCRQFVLLELEDLAPIKVLHAVNAPEPCFLVVDPTAVLPSYRCDLGSADRLRLGAPDDAPLAWLAIVIVDDGQIAVNLRAPIVIDPERMTGRQVLPNTGLYPLRYVVEGPL